MLLESLLLFTNYYYINIVATVSKFILIIYRYLMPRRITLTLIIFNYRPFQEKNVKNFNRKLTYKPITFKVLKLNLLTGCAHCKVIIYRIIVTSTITPSWSFNQIMNSFGLRVYGKVCIQA